MQPKQKPDYGVTRYLGLIVFVAFAFSIILGRLWYIQVINGDTYFRASTENIIRNVETRPPRGKILDAHGTVLAENRPSYDVFVHPHLVSEKDRPEVLTLLTKYLNLNETDLKRVEKGLEARAGEVSVRRDIPRYQVALLEGDRLRLPGLEIQANSHRYYPLEHVGSHVIGFVGEIRSQELKELRTTGYRPGDYIGRVGVESSFEAVLRGSPGIERSVVDARGIPQGEAETKFLIGDYQKVRPVPGRDVKLTLDSRLELIIDEAMKNYPSGAVVAVDPRDGSVLAAYSKPSFNPNSWSGRLSTTEKIQSDNNPYKPMLDKSISAYFPGSIFKLVGALAALEEGMMKPDDTIKCSGSYLFGGRRFRCWKSGGHGKMNVMEALQHSCDVYFYKVAETLGIDKIAEYAYRFGFGEPTGYPVNSESPGRVPTKEWHAKTTPGGFQHGFALNTVLGQGDTLTTPLQAALAYAALANGGTIYYPRLIDRILNADGSTLFEFEPRVRKTIKASDEHMAVLKKGLWMTVQEDGGTSYPYRIEEVEVSGKTGTAQVKKIGRIRVANRDKEFRFRDHAWFSAYAPSKEPTIAITVFLEHGGHGSSDATPVAMEILKRWFEGDDPRTRKIGDNVPEIFPSENPGNPGQDAELEEEEVADE